MKGHHGGSKYRRASRSRYDPQVLDCPSRSCSTALPFALIFFCSALLCWNTSSLYQNSSFPFWSGLFVRRMRTIKLEDTTSPHRESKEFLYFEWGERYSSPPIFISFIPPLFLSIFAFSKVYWLFFFFQEYHRYLLPSPTSQATHAGDSAVYTTRHYGHC